MAHRVFLQKRSEVGLRKAPKAVQNKFYKWVELVESIGLLDTQKIPGFHDEPLKGKRKGQRSVRLNRSWRAIYHVSSPKTIRIIVVDEVSKHEY